MLLLLFTAGQPGQTAPPAAGPVGPPAGITPVTLLHSTTGGSGPAAVAPTAPALLADVPSESALSPAALSPAPLPPSCTVSLCLV